ncbi:uncharacterized protein LOC117783499 [Drosophila innubila]|uniref:uncharacterized protein LOC117783499 n=1 Tax=Drosophila innubila TaxID=198719 RepID=UPI00148BC629|nr:uncharacterized protein LOC117783499 [Drosophila innubila]
MPGKNFSAVQRLAHSLYAPPRTFSGRTLTCKSFDPLSLHNRLTHIRAWPQREETFAAIQLMQQNRSWNNVKKFGSAVGHSMSTARRGITPRRNNILTAKSASAKRLAMLRDFSQKKTKAESRKKAAVDRFQLMESTSKKASAKRGYYNDEQDEDKNEDDVIRTRTIRDAVFGVPESNDEERKHQLEADEDLLKRVSRQRPFNSLSNLSRKVIAPYQTYKSHRNCWAEFRHRLVYGGSSYY